MTDAYRTAGTMAPAAATRARLAAGAGLGNACSWPAAAIAPISVAPSIVTKSMATKSMATKPATQKFVDVLDHRRRRLSEPSP